jgi:hypothetical protein
MWGVDADEQHREALGPGDHVLVYVGAPESVFIGRAQIASTARDWTPAEVAVYPGDARGGVLLAEVEEWEPPAPMAAVLARIASDTAKAEFDTGVVRISAREYATAVAVAASTL